MLNIKKRIGEFREWQREGIPQNTFLPEEAEDMLSGMTIARNKQLLVGLVAGFVYLKR